MIVFTSVQISERKYKRKPLINRKSLWFYSFLILKLNATFKKSIDEPHTHY